MKKLTPGDRFLLGMAVLVAAAVIYTLIKLVIAFTAVILICYGLGTAAEKTLDTLEEKNII